MCTKQLYRIVDFNKIGRDGKQEVFFWSDKNHDVNLLYPFPRYLPQQIQCGQCWECKAQKAQEWAFRCMKEARLYENNIMINLTYDNNNVPRSNYVDKETGELKESLTLKKKDVEDFMKRLRKHYSDIKIRFFMCGEYGSDEEYVDWRGETRKATERPHYHIICLNLNVEDMKFFRWKKCEWSAEKNALYKSKTISKIWGKGDVELNEVNYETCCYVARYTSKKLFGEKSIEEYDDKGRQVPYINMSRRPGIGYDFFEENKEKFENDRQFYQVTKKGLKTIKPGRYYDKLIEKDNPELLKKIKSTRLNKAFEYWNEIIALTNITKHEYIANREYSNNQKSKKLVRRLG